MILYYRICRDILTLDIQHSIELERQINEGHQLIQDMEARGVNLTVEQLPISAIIRCPLLALRWRLPNNKVDTCCFLSYVKKFNYYRSVVFSSSLDPAKTLILFTIIFIN